MSENENQSPENDENLPNIHRLLPLAQQGNPIAQYNLGAMYSNGEGVAQDYKEVIQWYRLAAEQEHPNA